MLASRKSPPSFVEEASRASPTTSRRHSPLAHRSERPGSRVRRAKGGTLFERMSNIARGAAKAQVDEEPPASAPTAIRSTFRASSTARTTSRRSHLKRCHRLVAGAHRFALKSNRLDIARKSFGGLISRHDFFTDEALRPGAALLAGLSLRLDRPARADRHATGRRQCPAAAGGSRHARSPATFAISTPRRAIWSSLIGAGQCRARASATRRRRSPSSPAPRKSRRATAASRWASARPSSRWSSRRPRSNSSPRRSRWARRCSIRRRAIAASPTT